MKYLAILLLTLGLIASCTKDSSNNDNCKAVIITKSAPGCGGWGIVVNNIKYPSSNIPTQFQQDGITVCAVYELYQDARLCVCCGGTWADIKSMKTFVR